MPRCRWQRVGSWILNGSSGGHVLGNCVTRLRPRRKQKDEWVNATLIIWLRIAVAWRIH